MIVFGVVYKVTNKKNGKLYIGITTRDLEVRKRQHECTAKRGGNPNSGLHNALRKHGKDAFEWEIIDEAETEVDLVHKEISYIEEYDTYINGYNSTKGGGGITGFEMSQETKDKISKSSLEFWENKSDEYRKKYGEHLSKVLTGREFTEEHRKNISESRKGKFTGEDNPFYGRTHTQETKDKLSKANSGNVSPCRVPVVALDKDRNVVKEFEYKLQAFEWLNDNNYCKSNNARSVLGSIKEAIETDGFYYGFYWEYL